MKRPIEVCVTCFALILSLSACTNPYDPGQRFVGGGLLGAASGAAIGGAAGGGPGAAMGAAIGAAADAFGGVATTPHHTASTTDIPAITPIPRITLIMAIPVITAITDSGAQRNQSATMAPASDKFRSAGLAIRRANTACGS